MGFRHTCIGLAGGMALCALGFAVQAAPLSNGGSGVKSGVATSSSVEKAAYRCRWRQGYRVCRRVAYYPAYDEAALARAAASSVPMP